MTDEQKVLYKSWSKRKIYSAYLLEYHTRVKLNKQLNEARREIQKMKYDVKQLLN